MFFNSLFGFSGSSEISFEHITQIAFPNMSATPNLPKKDPSTDRFCSLYDCFFGLQLGPPQGRNKVRWGPGQEASLAPSGWNLRSFGNKCTVLKIVLVTLLGHSGVPRSDLAPGEICPLALPVTPLVLLETNYP